MITTVRQLLEKKGHKVWKVDPDTSVYGAIEIMANESVGALVVMDGERIAGIISERDYARKVILRERSSKTTLVREIMTTRVMVVDPDCDAEAALAIMSEHRIRHLPVVENGKLVGVISSGDVVKMLVEHKQFVIDQLTHYISGY